MATSGIDRAQQPSFENLSHHESLSKLLEAMDYEGLKAERDALRAQGIHRGIGIASFIEVTNPSAMFYGVGGARISAQDGATMRLDARGNVFVATGATEQGQGMEAVNSQVAATAVGVPPERLKITTGDTEHTPYGGGTWASRAAGIGGEAVAQAGRALRGQILSAAGIMLQEDASTLDIRNGVVVDADTGAERIGLDEVGRICYYRPTRCRTDSSPSSSRPGTTCRASTPSHSPTASRPPIWRSIPRPGSSPC